MSTPSSSHTCVAYKLGGWPRTACTPAEATSMSLRLPSIRQKRPSAMGLRQMLPVQTKRTLFTMDAAARAHANQPKIEKGQVNRAAREVTTVVCPGRSQFGERASLDWLGSAIGAFCL